MTDQTRSAAPVAIVTGGGRGMGAAIARELHARGYRVALMSPSGSAKSLATELDGVGVSGSVESTNDLEALVDATMARFGRIDAVVSHTGHPPKGHLVDILYEGWGRGNTMMVLSVVRIARLVTPVMLRQGKGALFNLTTFAAFEPTLAFPVSCAYWAAVGAFTKLCADRYAVDGIRINALLPGYIDSLNRKPETAAAVPMRRIGRTEEIAETAAFLLSDDAGYITRQNVRVDGGITRHV